jgi:hypothetical protein
MDEHYLSEDIVIRDNHTYYQDVLIKRHNWHIKLAELGWTKLHKQWISCLHTYHKPYPTNSLFGSLDCGGDGDCLFHCISYALNSEILANDALDRNELYDSQDIRNRIAYSVTEEQFTHIIECYRCMKDIDDFDESWDPYDIETVEQFREELCKPGHSYWGDHLLLQLLMDTFHINIFILTQDEYNGNYTPYKHMNVYDSTHKTIILLHENNSHFTLVGYFRNIMVTYFDDDSLPLEIKGLFRLS